MLLQYMQISLCFRIISFFKKANKLWVSTLGVQLNFCKTLHGKHEEALWSSLWKKHSSLSFLRKGWLSKSWKVCFNLFSSELTCTVLCVSFPSFWRRQKFAVLYHCADCVQVRIESYCLPFHWLRIGVVHGVLKSCLAIVIFMNWTSCILCFGCCPVDENIG